MTTMKIFISFFIFSTLCSSVFGAISCNFGPACQCTTDAPPKKNQTDYHSAVCTFSKNVGSLVTNPGNYTVYILFIELHDATVFEIPANYFSGFQSITILTLTSYSGYIPHNWDPNAFDGVGYGPISIRPNGIDNLFPAPVALQKLAARGLQEYSIEGSGSFRLEDNYFSNFTNLLEFNIYFFDETVSIDYIGDHAFAGLEKSLARLYLPQTSLKDFPATALSKLENLTRLYLAAGNFKNWPSNSLTPLTKLVELDLSNTGQYGGVLQGTTDLGKALEAGALNSLPPTINQLEFRYTNLTAIPPKSPTNIGGQLDFEGNLITAVKKGDFSGSESTSAYVNLNFNPVTKIEEDAFPPLKSGQYGFGNTQLETIDLSVFSFTESANVLVTFSGNTITALTVSNLKKIPSTAKIQLRLDASPNLVHVDSSIGDMLNQTPGTTVTFVSQNIECNDSIGWMSFYVFCTKQLNVYGAVCKDSGGQQIKNYLYTNFGFSACPPFQLGG